jgi:hypothetical protein
MIINELSVSEQTTRNRYSLGDSALAMAIYQIQLRPHRATRQLVSGLQNRRVAPRRT